MNEQSEYVEIHRFRLWFALLGGAVAWTAHLLLSYGVAEFGCVSRFGDRTLMGISAVAWLGIAVTAVTLLVALAATVVAKRIERRLIGDVDAAEYEVSDGRVFMARVGWITSGLFVFIILVESLPLLYYLRSC